MMIGVGYVIGPVVGSLIYEVRLLLVSYQYTLIMVSVGLTSDSKFFHYFIIKVAFHLFFSKRWLTLFHIIL